MEKSTQMPARLLRSIGMHPRYKGYAYIYYILCEVQTYPERLYTLRTTVYPALMSRFNCTQAGIERNIRFVVQRTFEKGDTQMLKQLFGARHTEWPPTNTEFIAVLAQCLIHDFVDFRYGAMDECVVK